MPAGVAAGTALRPRIAIASLLVAVLPTVAVLLFQSDPAYIASAIALAGFLTGGMRSLLRRYRTEAMSTAKRHGFAALARRDHLTGLANRLELAERFDRLCTEGFRTKRVGDPTISTWTISSRSTIGSAIRPATRCCARVAGRLRDHIRGDDIAARLGGDEFVVVQTAVRDEEEVAAMARRLERDLAEPYALDGREIVIGASVGWCLDDTAEPLLDALLQQADDALRLRKAERKSQPAGGTTGPGFGAGSTPGVPPSCRCPDMTAAAERLTASQSRQAGQWAGRKPWGDAPARPGRSPMTNRLRSIAAIASCPLTVSVTDTRR